MKNKSCYICIEGLDASGKGTIIKRLEEDLKTRGYSYQIIAPTSIQNEKDILERVYKKYKKTLEKSRVYRMFLYAKRSNRATEYTNWSTDLVIGDRSIVISYVTRWGKTAITQKMIELFVNTFESKPFAPDHIVFLDVPNHILDERLDNRDEPRDIDENSKRRDEMKNAYMEIYNNKPIKRIQKTQWHIMKYDTDDDDYYRKILELILKLKDESNK